MNVYAMLFYLAFYSFLTSCSGTNCQELGNFSGITERDDKGVLLSEDKDDWTLNDHWNEQQLALFDTTYKTDCLPSSHFTIYAYPNPTEGQFQVKFNKTTATKIDLRLIDSDCNIISSQNDIEDNSYGLRATADKDGEVLRLYYRFIEDGCQYEGHGDIMVRL